MTGQCLLNRRQRGFSYEYNGPAMQHNNRRQSSVPAQPPPSAVLPHPQSGSRALS